MSNLVAKEDTLQEILTMCNKIKVYTGIIAQGGDADSWANVKRQVKEGMAADLYPVGSQLVDTWYKNTETSYNAPWDVVHYNAAGDMFLKWHYGLPDTLQFDAPEAIYYAPSGGLAAGQYYITIGMDYGEGWKAGDHINFTLQNAMEEGDQLRIEMGEDNKNDPTNGRTWKVFAAGDTTAKETGTTSNSATGTELGSTSSTGIGYTNGNINAPQRVTYGYGRWSQSAFRQYLNSSAAASAWWTMQNPWDRPPEQHSTLQGFLAGLSADFLSVLEPQDIVTAINTVEGSADAFETTQDRIFLPSLQEMYIAPQLANKEGEDWDYYKELAQEAGLSGKFQQYGTYEILKTYYIHNKTSACGARLRSSYRGTSYATWNVYSSGNVDGNNAYYAFSGAPACIIRKS